MALDFGGLVDATNAARREYDVVIVLDGTEYSLIDVEVTTQSLDGAVDWEAVAKGTAEPMRGHSHEGQTVRLIAG